MFFQLLKVGWHVWMQFVSIMQQVRVFFYCCFFPQFFLFLLKHKAPVIFCSLKKNLPTRCELAARFNHVGTSTVSWHSLYTEMMWCHYSSCFSYQGFIFLFVLKNRAAFVCLFSGSDVEKNKAPSQQHLFVPQFAVLWQDDPVLSHCSHCQSRECFSLHAFFSDCCWRIEFFFSFFFLRVQPMFTVAALLLTAVQNPCLLFHCGRGRTTELSIQVAPPLAGSASLMHLRDRITGMAVLPMM